MSARILIAEDDEDLRDLLQDDLEASARLLETDEAQITMAFSSSQGMDHHDRLHHVARSLELSPESLVSKVVDMGFHRPGHWRESADLRYAELCQLIGEPLDVEASEEGAAGGAGRNHAGGPQKIPS